MPVIEKTIVVGQLNSELGREYAKALRASSLSEIASWCEMAQNALERSDAADQQADAGIYQDAACTLRQLARFAA